MVCVVHDGRVSSPAHARAEPSADSPVARFLVGASNTPPALEEVRRATLSGVILARVPDHPHQTELRLDAFRTAARHLATKTELHRLFLAWNEAGVVPLVIKGFYLSEFVYSAASLRVYNDVDVYVQPDQVPTACDVASRVGWEVAWRSDERDHIRAWRGSGYHGHEAAQLQHPTLGVGIDIHRRIVHNSHERVPRFEVQARLTEAAVQAAREAEWAGARIMTPSPIDAVVFGLALNRSWSADRWHVKPRDYCDLEALRQRYQLHRDAIVERARELGVQHTVEIYLGRCDPFRCRLFTRSPRWKAWWWNLGILNERGPHDLIRSSRRALDTVIQVAGGSWVLVHSWPLADRAVRFVRRRKRIEDWAARHPVAERQGNVGRQAWSTFVRAVHRHQRLRRIPYDRRQTVAALIAFAWLRKRGYAVELLDASNAHEQVTLLLDGSPLAATPPTYDATAEQAENASVTRPVTPAPRTTPENVPAVDRPDRPSRPTR